jgi:hypothetical protein
MIKSLILITWFCDSLGVNLFPPFLPEKFIYTLLTGAMIACSGVAVSLHLQEISLITRFDLFKITSTASVA